MAAWGWLCTLHVFAIGLRVALAQLLRRCRGGFRAPAVPLQPGRVAVVTGASEGIGLCTASQLARLGMRVILAGNDEEKGEDAVRKIKEETLNDKVEFMFCDLASLASIRQFVQEFQRKNLPLHVLINNAGVMMVPWSLSADGLERHWAVNAVGPLLLTRLLLPALRDAGSRGPRARVVSLASATHRAAGLRPAERDPGPRAYWAAAAYARSKLALLLLTFRLQRLMEARGLPVTASAADPGVVSTGLYDRAGWAARAARALLGPLLFKSPAEGAWTPVLAAVSPRLEARGGLYLLDEAEARARPLAYDEELQRRVWARGCADAGLHPDLGPGLDGAPLLHMKTHSA